MSDYPRLGMWWPDHDTQSVADIARYDWVGMQNHDSAHIAELRAVNPSIKLFGSNNAQELNYRENDYNHAMNVELRSASLTWALTQVGSTLSAAINASTTTVPVHGVASGALTLFATGDVFVIDEELFKVSSIDSLNLTVQRGTSMGTPAAPHAAGARVAAVVSGWPGSLTMNVTDGCPLADVGHGAEQWTDWNAIRLHTALDAADWDGMIIDVMDTVEAYSIGSGSLPIRSIDPDRSNTVISDYSAFDAAWNAGNLAYAAEVRELVGEDAIVFPNTGVRAFDDLNGAIFESFPQLATASRTWRDFTIGPRNLIVDSSYLEWCAARSPSYAHLETYEYEGEPDDPMRTPNYQKMRYGLCTALMGDGYFSYEGSSYGHGALGLWWFDEYDNAGAGRGYLGQPLADAYMTTAANADLLSGNGDMASGAHYNAWTLTVDGDPGAASMANDAGTAKVTVTEASLYEGDPYPGGIRLTHPVAVAPGKTYRVTFRAKGDAICRVASVLRVSSNDNASSDNNWLTTDWRDYTAVITSTQTGTGVLWLYFGSYLGNFWFDDVTVREIVPEAWRRDFEHGIVLVNAETTSQTVALGKAYQKIDGTQDAAVNDGSFVTSVTLAARDGIILRNNRRIGLRVV